METETTWSYQVPLAQMCIRDRVKSLFRTTKPLIMIPGCFLGGAVFCQVCDLLARTVFSPTELSISTVTAIFGAPVVIWILIHRQKSKGV